MNNHLVDSENGLFMDVVEKLLKFGLAKNEAKAYVALLRLREGKGESIARLSGIARQEAYRVVSNLEELGLVERIVANPTRFRPTPLQDGLSKLIKDEKEMATRKISELEETRREIAYRFNDSDCTSEDGTSFTRVFLEKRMFERELKLMEGAKKKILLAACSHDLLSLQRYGAIKLMRRSNGNRCLKILCTNVSEPREEVEVKQAYGYFDLRYLEGFAGHILTVDGELAVVKLEANKALEPNGKIFVKTQECIFEHLWQAAGLSQAEE